jgi:photosystem II stability/assembly factor-like uncharacterized protein
VPKPESFIRVFACLAILGVAARAEAAVTPAQEKPKSELGALKFRVLGPAISGRVDRVAGVPGDPLTYYAAFSQGGVWKSENGGRDWKPVFDEMPTNSVGSIAVAGSDPNVLYVGSGEANIRGNVALGTGIFKSVDAGKDWQQVWKGRGQIGTMAIDPRNADIAFAAVLGSPFGPGKERGVYRTTDGGKSWQQVLYVDEKTGASDVAFDPNNSHILYAGMWQAERKPWTLTSGGPGSGLYRSRDGGETWQRLKGKGLPDGEWGRVGVRVAPSDSNIVYAMIEAKDGGLYRSRDGGDSWEYASGAHVLRQRAWYYTTLSIDPTDPDVVWAPQVRLVRTIDGGKSWQSVKGPSHGDHHDVWIDPRNPKRILDGNDGGISLSIDGGATWVSPPTPTGQLYNIDVDDRLPYHVGGTFQDQGTASGPAYVLRPGGGPDLGDFYYVGGGESGDFLYEPGAPGNIFAGGYSGYLTHYQEQTGNVRNISPYPRNFSGTPASESRYRFQWTAPLAISPHDPKVLYAGANVLFRTRDRGGHWDVISPDLTRNDKSKQQWTGGPITGDLTGVEVYDTIFAIAESPAAAGEVWVGTDDGLVQLTRDDGRSWKNVTPRGLPEWATIDAIEPSYHDSGTAYVVADAHRLDDYHPYLYRTRDYGQSWEPLGQGLPSDQHLYVVREDPTDPNLLYVGSERGLWFSRDAGKSFRDLRSNLPPVGVSDIVVKHGDLILGTRRGIWILDDISALRAFTPVITSDAVHLFTPRPAHRFRLDTRQDNDREGQAEKASSSPMWMNVTYWLKAERKDEPGKPPHAPIKLEIYDAQGQLVRTLSSVVKPNRYGPDDADDPQEAAKPELTTDAGINRVQWDLRFEGAKRLQHAKLDSGDPDDGPVALPGEYTLKLTVDGQTESAIGTVLADPRSPVHMEQLQQNLAFTLQTRTALDRLTDDIEEVRAIRAQAQDLKARLAANSSDEALLGSAETLAQAGGRGGIRRPGRPQGRRQALFPACGAVQRHAVLGLRARPGAAGPVAGKPGRYAADRGAAPGHARPGPGAARGAGRGAGIAACYPA